MRMLRSEIFLFDNGENSGITELSGITEPYYIQEFLLKSILIDQAYKEGHSSKTHA